MSSKSNGRATHEPGANAAMTARMTGRSATINEASRAAAIQDILRASREGAAKGQKGHVSALVRAETHAKVERARAIERRAQAAEEHPEAERQTRTRGIRRRASGGPRGANPTRHSARRVTALERREQNLNAVRRQPKNDFKPTTTVMPSKARKPENATERAIRLGQNRQHTMTPEEHAAGAQRARAVAGQLTKARKTLTAAEQRDYKWLKTNRTQLESHVAQHADLERQAHATLANPHASEADKLEARLDIPYARAQAHAAQANLNLLDQFNERLGIAKAESRAAREARLAPLRAHLSGLKAAKSADAVGAWLGEKYPHLRVDLGATGVNARGKPTQLAGGMARRVAATYATLAHEFPSAAQHVSGLTFFPHTAPGTHDDLVSSNQGTITLGGAFARRGGVKSAQSGNGGNGGKPLAPEALIRQAFATAVHRDLSGRLSEPDLKAYNKWLDQYGASHFARAFTAMAYGRGSKGAKGEGRSSEVRALKRALALAYPTANLTQKPIKPTE